MWAGAPSASPLSQHHSLRIRRTLPGSFRPAGQPHGLSHLQKVDRRGRDVIFSHLPWRVTGRPEFPILGIGKYSEGCLQLIAAECGKKSHLLPNKHLSLASTLGTALARHYQLKPSPHTWTEHCSGKVSEELNTPCKQNQTSMKYMIHLLNEQQTWKPVFYLLQCTIKYRCINFSM